jgi:phosphate-selective porin OprO/OprP
VGISIIDRPLLISLFLVSCTFFGWPTDSRAQERSPPDPPLIDTTDAIAPSANSNPELFNYLRNMERRLNWLTKQNDDLARKNRTLAEQFHDLSWKITNSRPRPRPQSGLTGDVVFSNFSDDAARPDDVIGMIDFEDSDAAAGPGLAGDFYESAGRPSEHDAPYTAGGGSKASGGDPTTTGRAQEDGNRHLGKLSLNAYYDFDNDGFNFSTEDDEYSFGIRGMEQLDGKVYAQPAPGFASSGIYNPRSRFYLEGHLTKPIQYEFSFQQTYDSVNLLDAYINFNYDSRFQLRFGRYKTPFTYEWYRIHIWDLLAPERSLFATNYEGQRRFGVMGWGTLFENRVEYAVGSFDTQRNGYQAFNSLQDVMAFVNVKPFYNEDRGFLLRDLQFGGSVNAGHENQPVSPAALRTNSPPSPGTFSNSGAANAATVPFLAFNPGVTEKGDRALWELHTAWYSGGLTLLGAWQSGFESYAKTAGASNRIPIDGWFVQAGYIFTGETIRDRTLVDPIHPFDLRRGCFGLGALEPTARYSELTLDRRVFTDGFADPTLWTNQARLIDVGFNWYLNKFVKVYFDWERALFGSAVFSGNGRSQTSNDLYWIRTQVYF